VRSASVGFSREEIQRALLPAIEAALSDLDLDPDNLDRPHARRLTRALLHLAARTAYRLRWDASQYLAGALQALAKEGVPLDEVSTLLATAPTTIAKA
jgi:hypothetical protein